MLCVSVCDNEFVRGAHKTATREQHRKTHNILDRVGSLRG
jgi:hypothetical protein